MYATDVRSGKLCALLYDNLVQFDTKANIIPSLAHKWIITNNGKTYTFNIRNNVEFINGTVLNSDIVKQSFERISNKSLYNNIESIIADTDSTVTFNLKKTEPSFLSKLAMPIASVVHIDQNKVLHGTGPWILDEWVKDGHIILHRNMNYFNGMANFNRIVIRIINDPFPRVASFTAGYIDIIEIPDSEKKMWEDNNKITAQVKTIDELNTYYIGLNCAREPLSNKKVRQALNYAIDINKIIEHLKDGYATRAIGPIPPDLQIMKNNQKYIYNPDLANKLLEEAGYKNGFDIELWQTQDQEILNISEVIQAELKKIGINIKIITRDWNSLSSAVRNGTPDMYYRSWYADYPDPENFISPLFESEISKKKWNRYSNYTLDNLIDSIETELDFNRRAQLIYDANEIIIDDAPWIFLWHEKNSYISQNWIINWEPPLMFNAEKYISIDHDQNIN